MHLIYNKQKLYVKTREMSPSSAKLEREKHVFNSRFVDNGKRIKASSSDIRLASRRMPIDCINIEYKLLKQL